MFLSIRLSTRAGVKDIALIFLKNVRIVWAAHQIFLTFFVKN